MHRYQRLAVIAAIAMGLTGTTTTAPAAVYLTSHRHGVLPTISQLAAIEANQEHVPPQTLVYGGGIDSIGVANGHQKVYLVFWGTQWGTNATDANGNLTFSSDKAGAAPYVQQLLKGLGTGNEQWSGTMTQYCDGPNVSAGATYCPQNAAHVGYPAGGALAGVWYDNSGPEPAAPNGNLLAKEAVNAASHFSNTSAAANRHAQYVIFSATGTDPDSWRQNNYCAWHDYNGDSMLTGGPATSPYGDIAFTNLPYVLDVGANCGQNFVNTNGTLDGFSIVEGHEYAETSTDQNPPGGWTSVGNLAGWGGGQEDGDECAWIKSGNRGASANVALGDGTFAMQSTWSNDTYGCDIAHPVFGAPGTVQVANPGDQPGLAGATVNLQLSASGGTAPYTWSAQRLPSGLSINSTSGAISGVLPSGGGSSDGCSYTYYVITATATDNAGAKGSATFQWVVGQTTLCIDNPGEQKSLAGKSLTLQLPPTTAPRHTPGRRRVCPPACRSTPPAV
jgi:serine protease